MSALISSEAYLEPPTEPTPAIDGCVLRYSEDPEAITLLYKSTKALLDSCTESEARTLNQEYLLGLAITVITTGILVSEHVIGYTELEKRIAEKLGADTVAMVGKDVLSDITAHQVEGMFSRETGIRQPRKFVVPEDASWKTLAVRRYRAGIKPDWDDWDLENEVDTVN